MNMPDNPKAVIGDNAAPDWAKIETERLDLEYADLSRNVTELLDEARDVPATIQDDAAKGTVVNLIKRFRDITKKIAGLHELEKHPHLRRGQAADQWFFGLIDKCARRDKRARAGASDILNARLTDYDNRILAERQEAARLEALRLARIETEKREAAEKLEREAREAREAAERARAPAQIAAKTAEADRLESAASAAAVEATVTATKAEEGYIQTLAKASDIMRQRGDDGSLSTMAQETYAELDDRTKLDFVKLGPYFTVGAVEQSLRGFAKATDYRTPMDGAKIGRRNKSKVL